MLNKIKEIKYELGVFVLYVLSRLPALGFDTFNTDVWKWKQRIYDFGTGVFTGNFEMTIQKYHPGVPLMWIGTVAVKIYNAWSKLVRGALPTDNNINFVFELNFLQKLLIVLVTGVVLAYVFYVLRKLFSVKYASIALVLFALEPFYIFLSREIHLEGLMTTFMVASLVSLFAFTSGLVQITGNSTGQVASKKSYLYLYLSAFFAGLAVLTKSSAIILFPFMGLMILLNAFHAGSKEFTLNTSISNKLKSIIVSVGIWLGVFIATFVILWPAMWIAPVKAFKTVFGGVVDTGIEEGHFQYYFGELVKDPGYFYYFVVFWIRSSLYLILGLIGLPFIFKKLQNKKQEFVLTLVLFAIVYLVVMMVPSKKLDRYILPAMMALVLAVSFVFEWLADLIINWIFNNKISLVQGNVKLASDSHIVGRLLILPAVITAIYLYPNFASYYNPLAGGLKKGMFIVEPKWGFGQRELTAELDRIKTEDNLKGFEGSSLKKLYYKSILKEKLVVAFPIQFYSQLYPFVYSLDGWPTIDTLRQDAQQSNYFVYPVWDEESPAFKNYNLKYRSTVYLRGTAIYDIYDRGEIAPRE